MSIGPQKGVGAGALCGLHTPGLTAQKQGFSVEADSPSRSLSPAAMGVRCVAFGDKAEAADPATQNAQAVVLQHLPCSHTENHSSIGKQLTPFCNLTAIL